MTIRSLIPQCPCCKTTPRFLNWQPFDGQWECPDCYEADIDKLIPIGPDDARFPFCNLNPDL
jgi:hypothetical protein